MLFRLPVNKHCVIKQRDEDNGPHLVATPFQARSNFKIDTTPTAMSCLTSKNKNKMYSWFNLKHRKHAIRKRTIDY